MANFLDSVGLARFWEKVKAYVDQNMGGGGGVPSGCIVAWSGASTAIPDGWALCDGTNGTPDLRGRFVLGAGPSYEVGATGGEAAHTLTTAEMPSHSHTFLVRITGTSYGGSYSTDRCTSTTSSSKYAFQSGSTGSNGSTTPHNNMPPYYALCYIMKL